MENDTLRDEDISAYENEDVQFVEGVNTQNKTLGDLEKFTV